MMKISVVVGVHGCMPTWKPIHHKASQIFTVYNYISMELTQRWKRKEVGRKMNLDYLCFLPKFACWSPTPAVWWYLEMRAFRVGDFSRVGPHDGITEDKAISFSLHREEQGTWTPREPRKRSKNETYMPALGLGASTFQPPNSDKYISFCLSHPTGGIPCYGKEKKEGEGRKNKGKRK